jgi:hypothetical protein
VVAAEHDDHFVECLYPGAILKEVGSLSSVVDHVQGPNESNDLNLEARSVHQEDWKIADTVPTPEEEEHVKAGLPVSNQ